MTSNIQNGFIIPKCRSVYIKQDDCKKFGIKGEDWAKVDKNQDGKISIEELLLNGQNITSINKAYKTLAIQKNGYVNNEQEKELKTSNNIQNQNTDKKYHLNHPNITTPILANQYDYLA